MPGMAQASRPALEDPSPLGAQAFMQTIEGLARSRELAGFRVAYKMNAAGEHVVALIYPPQAP